MGMGLSRGFVCDQGVGVVHGVSFGPFRGRGEW